MPESTTSSIPERPKPKVAERSADPVRKAAKMVRPGDALTVTYPVRRVVLEGKRVAVTLEDGTDAGTTIEFGPDDAVVVDDG